MKPIFILFFLVFSGLSSAQGTGLIVGNILDKEVDNTPLAFASVHVKGTDINTSTDFSGLFLIENIEAGDYILVYNFPGYETKEINVTVVSEKPTELKLVLGAQSLSYNELASNNSVHQKDNSSTSKLNKDI
tara:strand:- start:192 stop:587 length:396 start_codon:yes stop_codon:yes gene_type:complete